MNETGNYQTWNLIFKMKKVYFLWVNVMCHYSDVIMSAMASQITSLMIVSSTVYSDADQRKHQSSASLAFLGGIHLSPVNSPHKRPVMREMLPYDDAIMTYITADKKSVIVWCNACCIFINPCIGRWRLVISSAMLNDAFVTIFVNCVIVQCIVSNIWLNSSPPFYIMNVLQHHNVP